MRYPVIVEQKNGHWRAVIPSLSNLTADGATCDEAVRNAQRAAEDYLSQVVIATIDVETPHVSGVEGSGDGLSSQNPENSP